MPYSSIDEAKKGGMKTVLGDVPLTLAQVNHLSQMYDKIKAQGGVDNPMAVAISTFKKAYEVKDGKWVRREAATDETQMNELITLTIKEFTELYTMEKEIFMAGKWNNTIYTEVDIDKIISAFNEGVISKDGVPLKLGHSDKQGILQKNGYAAAGWVESLKRVGKKLIAKFKDIPKVIAELIKNNAYKNVSVELYHDYTYPLNGKKYDSCG